MTDKKWADAALGKYFRLAGETSGLIAGAGAAGDRVNSLLLRRRDAEQRIVELDEFISFAPGRNENVVREREEAERELQQIAAVLPVAVVARDGLRQKITTAGTVSYSCGRLLVALKILNPGEVVR